MNNTVKVTIHNNIGKAKYVVAYSYGLKTHKDGSEFFDHAIFKNKKDLSAFVTKLYTQPTVK